MRLGRVVSAVVLVNLVAVVAGAALVGPSEGVAEPVDFSKVFPIEHGHFDRTAAPFRHWDKDGIVPVPCSRCHTAEGLPAFLQRGEVIDRPPSESLDCSTCHDDLMAFTRRPVPNVTFPAGVLVDLATVDPQHGPDANLCLNCHQGRESTVSVDRLIGTIAPDRTSETLRFLNIHYFAAGATLFGTEARGAYEYAGHSYRGRNHHVPAFDTCTECHSPHTRGVPVVACEGCHATAAGGNLRNIRMRRLDYDGDGDTREGIAGEIEGMAAALFVAMNNYAPRIEGVDRITYDPARYPYFFNTDGKGYQTWTPRLLRAAYNYQYANKDPGGFVHNGRYLLQVLYDSLEDLGAPMDGMTRAP